ncbi:MAG: 50S ribosomal protein L3 [bacterium]|nr:50S ribosomal protein L3 [bacterium]
MQLGILGRKIGMTQLFGEDRRLIPVTVISTDPCLVVQLKDMDSDGYKAVQLGFEKQKEKSTTKSLRGHFKKANVSPMKNLREFRLDDISGYNPGQEIKADGFFKPGEYVDVTGTSKGKGFAGVIKRWGFKGGKASHGSMFHRAPGSIGSSAWPSRVYKGKRLPGRLGGKRSTIQNLEVVKIETEKNLLLVRGATPGRKGTLLIIRKAKKK